MKLFQKSMAFLALLAFFAAPAFALDATPPSSSVKLVFIHHSTGENWLEDGNGGLGAALMANNYFVSDTNYGWGPDLAEVGGLPIGDATDIGYWYWWFAGQNRDTYTASLYAESQQNSYYSRLAADPGGENEIVMFKSCFPNSHLGGTATEAPTTGDNPLRGQDAYSEYMTVANAKGIYNDILPYFQSRPDKLFVVITAPPLVTGDTDAAHAANARAFNNWLKSSWLASYPLNNVKVFDFFNVLTSNGGDVNTNDAGSAGGNHHRLENGVELHVQNNPSNLSAYATGAEDSHPTAAGGQKATVEFVPLLNAWYNQFKGTAAPTGPSAQVAMTGGGACAAGGSVGIAVSASGQGAVDVYLALVVPGMGIRTLLPSFTWSETNQIQALLSGWTVSAIQVPLTLPVPADLSTGPAFVYLVVTAAGQSPLAAANWLASGYVALSVTAP